MFRGVRFLLILIISTLPVLLLSGCDSHETASAPVGKLMQQYHDIGQFTGAVLVSHKGRVVLEKAYGEANREWHVKNTVDTKFRLGSATKQFTAALILDLAEEGILSLYGSVSDYLPEYREDIGKLVTIRHLLTHSSGITMPKMTSEEYWDFFQKRWTTRQLVEHLCSDDLAFKPGEKFSYSSAGYILLGAIIEKVTGKSYEDVLKERILDPFGMKNTGIDDPEAILPKRASGYQTNYGFGNARYKYMPGSFSSGAVYSTVGDLYKWDQALHSTDFLGEEMKTLMFSPQIECSPNWFGYGWFIKQVPGPGDTPQTRLFHGGDVSGFCALIVRDLDTRDCVVLLSNQEGIHYNEIAANLLNTLNGRESVPPRAYVADLLREAVFKGGSESAASIYDQVKSEGLDEYNTSEAELTELGYDLLKIKMVKAAIDVFKINIELHSDSADAYDSLGEGYFVDGDHQTAIHYYEKALEVDPAYSHARKMLIEVKAAVKIN